MVDEQKEGVDVESISIVGEFIGVFLEDFPRLPPDWEIEFVIDVTPKTEPISITPYSMAPTELKKLKI